MEGTIEYDLNNKLSLFVSLKEYELTLSWAMRNAPQNSYNQAVDWFCNQSDRLEHIDIIISAVKHVINALLRLTLFLFIFYFIFLP